MISAILAAKALKKLRGGNMFTTGASPFNSKARQLYGGWTIGEAQAANNIWALRKAAAMEAKYGSDPQQVLEARRWLRNYNETRKANPSGMRLAMNRARRALGLGVVRKAPLSPAQKKAILEYWRGIKLSDKSPAASLRRKYISGVPYPPLGYLVENPLFQFPIQDVEGLDDSKLTVNELMTDPAWREDFFPTAAARKDWMKNHPAYKAFRFDKAAFGPKKVFDPSYYLGDLSDVTGAYETEFLPEDKYNEAMDKWLAANPGAVRVKREEDMNDAGNP